MIDLSPTLLNVLTLLTFFVPILSYFWKIRGDVGKISERQAADFESIKLDLEALKEEERDSRGLLAEVTKEHTAAVKELRLFLQNRFEMEDRIERILVRRKTDGA